MNIFKSHSEKFQLISGHALENGSRPLILDCGANVGFATIWFRLHFPEAVIVSIEPSDGNYAMLVKNTASFLNCIPIMGAVHSQSGTAHLHDPKTGEWGFYIVPSNTGEGPVKVFSIIDLLNVIRRRLAGQTLIPWICKIDIEGGEHGLFSGTCDWFSHFSLYAIELHDSHFPGRRVSSPFLSLVAKHGYEVIFNHEVLFAFRHSNPNGSLNTACF
jgi:FkbM family methyltransferase